MRSLFDRPIKMTMVNKTHHSKCGWWFRASGTLTPASRDTGATVSFSPWSRWGQWHHCLLTSASTVPFPSAARWQSLPSEPSYTQSTVGPEDSPTMDMMIPLCVLPGWVNDLDFSVILTEPTPGSQTESFPLQCVRLWMQRAEPVGCGVLNN